MQISPTHRVDAETHNSSRNETIVRIYHINNGSLRLNGIYLNTNTSSAAAGLDFDPIAMPLANITTVVHSAVRLSCGTPNPYNRTPMGLANYLRRLVVAALYPVRALPFRDNISDPFVVFVHFDIPHRSALMAPCVPFLVFTPA